MPQYFVHFQGDGGLVSDLEGAHFADDQAVIKDTRIAARELLIERIRTGRVIGNTELQVCDENGRIVETVTLLSQIKLSQARQH